MSFNGEAAAPFFVSMVKEIYAWIESGSPYQEGVDIYERYGNNTFLKTLFKRQENGFNRQKLAEEIDLLLLARPEPKQGKHQRIEFINGSSVKLPEVTIRPGLASGKNFDQVTMDSDPIDAIRYMAVKQRPNPDAPDTGPELLRVISRIEKNYSELRGLHPYLSILPEGEQLKELAFQIVKLGKENAELWNRRNFLAEGGVDLEEPEPEPEVPVMIDLNLLNRRESIRKSLSKARARLKKQKNPKPHTRKLVEQREQDLRLIDQEINEAKQKGSTDE